MPWILNEDAAIKAKLQGITVTDANAPPGGRKVPVRYRLPQDDLAALMYPVIIIEHQGLFPAPEREHRGYISLPYAPESYPIWWGQEDTTYNTDVPGPYYNNPGSPENFPLPYNFDYRVTVYSRNWLMHLAPIMNELAQPDRIPYHFGYVDVPQDGTRRTMILMNGPVQDYGKDEDGKRLFQAIYVIRVFSELLWMPPYQQYISGSTVHDININFDVYRSLADITSKELSEAYGILSVGSPAIAWNTLSQ